MLHRGIVECRYLLTSGYIMFLVMKFVERVFIGGKFFSKKIFIKCKGTIFL